MLVPSPGYPVYPVGTSFAGGVSHLMPLTKQNGFLPDLNAIPKDVAKKAKLMLLNSPNNPTSVIMNKDYFKRVVDFAQENQIIVCHDAAYSEIFYDGKPPASFMEVDGAKDVGDRVPLVIEDLQHDWLAHRVCRRDTSRSWPDSAR